MSVQKSNKIKIALFGNPNCGKTTLFNALTGSKQYVGNWPGVTVEKKSGILNISDLEVEIVDLPGIYSMTAFSLDEKIARSYVLDEAPDLILNVVDVTNLERNLYLTMQLTQLRKPMIIALNMYDLLEKLNFDVNLKKLHENLHCPVIPLSASKKEGLNGLKSLIAQVNDYPTFISNAKIHYDEIVTNSINTLIPIIKEFNTSNMDDVWFTMRVLENDEMFKNTVKSDLYPIIDKERDKIFKHSRIQVELLIADGLYGYINGLCKKVVKKNKRKENKFSDTLDDTFLHSFFGFPIFVFIMYVVFSFSMTLSTPFINFFDNIFGAVFVDAFSDFLIKINTPDWLKLFLADGIGGGIQTVSTFIPPIFLIFLCLSILEDSGYMARAAFVMDRMMRLLGLSGKAIIPMIVGFGCTVPAILATRTIDSKRDRLMTILLVPFIQCGAKIPVYTMFAVLFFKEYAGFLIFFLYFIGILFAVLSGFLFNKIVFKGKSSDFVMELPSYHIPTINGIMTHTWFKLKGFILKAGQTILFVIIILTMIQSLPVSSNSLTGKKESLLNHAGKLITPIFKPMGIEDDNWGASVALFTGLFAKEAIVGTFESIYNENTQPGFEKFNFFISARTAFVQLSDDLKFAIIKMFNPFYQQTKEQTLIDQTDNPLIYKFKNNHQVFAYLLFILIYAPCVASIASVQKEAGNKIAVFQVVYLTVLAWISATLYYQLSQINNGVNAILIIPVLLMILLLLYMKKLKIDN